MVSDYVFVVNIGDYTIHVTSEDLVEPQPTLAVEGVTVTRVDGPRHWLRFDRDHHTAASLISQVSDLAAVRGVMIEEPGHREHRAQHLQQHRPVALP